MIIVYDGNNLAKLCRKLLNEEVAIFTTKTNPQPEEAIYYMEKHEDPEILSSLPKAWAVEMENYHQSILVEYPQRIFTKKFKGPPQKGDLYVSGSIDAVSSLCRYLLKEYRFCIGLTGERYRLETLMEKNGERLGIYCGQPLHLHLGFGPREKPHLHLWDGSEEELHRLREEYEQLPRYHALIQWGLRGKHFYEHDLLQGRYLGKVSRRGFSFQWRKVLANYERP